MDVPAIMLAKESLPLHLDQRPEFTEFLTFLEPQRSTIHRNTINRSIEKQSRDVVNSMCERVKDVWNKTNIATTDMWSSNAGDRYCTISVHWITHVWKLATKTLGALTMNEEHTKENISRKMVMLRTKFRIWPKGDDCRIKCSMCLENVENVLIEELPHVTLYDIYTVHVVCTVGSSRPSPQIFVRMSFLG